MAHQYLPDACIHDEVLEQVVAVVGETKQNFLISFSIHVNLKLLDPTFAFFYDFSDFETEFFYSVKYILASRWQTHNHFYATSSNNVVVDPLTFFEYGVELFFRRGGLQEKGCDDHVQDNRAGILLLQNEVRRQIQSSLP